MTAHVERTEVGLHSFDDKHASISGANGGPGWLTMVLM